MTTSSIAIGLAVFIIKWTFIETQLIQVEPNRIIYAVHGQKLNISCYSDQDTYKRFEWSDVNGTYITKNKSNRVHSLGFRKGFRDYNVLIFNPFMAVDASTYRCCSKSKSGLICENAIKVTANVTDGYPPRFEIESVSYKIAERNDVLMDCYADGQPLPEYTWLDSHGRNMYNNVGNWKVSTEGWLRIYAINSSQEGIYTCVAINSYGDSSKSYNISVFQGRPPWFPQGTSNYEFAVGMFVVFSCHAEGSPSPKYVWYDMYGRNMHNLSGNWRASSDGYLEIHYIRKQQDGNYSCIAWNAYGNASKRFEVKVQDRSNYPPRFKIEFVSYEVVEGDDVLLNCYADGKPSPVYTWLDSHGRNMHNNVGNWNVSTEGWLKIYSINISQDGTYTCIATNSDGNASKLYMVNVSHGRSPSFRNESEYYEFVVGNDVILECHAEGYPSPEYVWYDKFGRNMHYIRGNWNASSKGSLEIYSIQQWQEGDYSCVAWNAHGNASKQFQIKLMTNDTELNVTVKDLWQTLVRFIIIVENASDTYRYVLAKYQGKGLSNYTWEKIKWTIGDEYIITGLKPGETYDFRFALKKSSYDEDDWLENPQLTLTLPPFSPLLIVNKLKEGIIEIEFPYQSLDEINGFLKPLYFTLRYVQLRQKSGAFYEADCPMIIQIPGCFTRKYVIGGLFSGYYYKLQLFAMLQSGPSNKSEIIVRAM